MLTQRCEQFGVCSAHAPSTMAQGRPSDEENQVHRSDAAVDRLVVLFADAGDETVSEVEVHWIVSLRALDV